MDFKTINAAQWITIGISLASLLFGGGLIWRFFFKHRPQENSQGNINKDGSDQTPLTVVRANPYLVKIKFKLGDYKEFEWDRSLVKISFLGIVNENFKTVVGDKQTLGVELQVDSGGGLIYGGEYTKKSDVNQYKVPLIISHYEEPYSLYFYHTGEKYCRFFRVFAEHINPHSEEAILNIFFFKTWLI